MRRDTEGIFETTARSGPRILEALAPLLPHGDARRDAAWAGDELAAFIAELDRRHQRASRRSPSAVLADDRRVNDIHPSCCLNGWRFQCRRALGSCRPAAGPAARDECEVRDLAAAHRANVRHEHSSTQLSLAHQLGLGFLGLDRGWLRFDAEIRLVKASGADVTFMTFDLVARADALRFGGSAE